MEARVVKFEKRKELFWGDQTLVSGGPDPTVVSLVTNLD
jgi:hypothetical protein